VALRTGLLALVVWLSAAAAAQASNLTSGRGDSSPVFSPDGRRVAFERRGSNFTVRVAGGATRGLLRGAREPSWSR
jgi:dipeptidyl aminopeptidase/acylaminoacyl peptidase